MKRVVEGPHMGNAPVKMWIDEVEDSAMQQLMNLSQLPFIHRHIAVMPDCHAGIGSTVGSVIPTKGAIIPAAVGVDIGCGMVAARTNLTANHMPDSLIDIRLRIESMVPHGRTDNGQTMDRGAWGEPPADVTAAWAGLATEFKEIGDRTPGLFKKNVNSLRHLGTLGTGNHFIEICLDEEDQVWIMLHSGSRGVGNRIGTHFINLAKEDMKAWFINPPDADLAYLPEGTEHFDAYWQAVDWAQRFARANRAVMLERTRLALARTMNFPIEFTMEAVNCHHNYVSIENHFGANIYVTRKGAVRARQGDLGIIPGSMGQRSFIVEGLGNPQSFNSCSHGAGRVMSRTAARKQFTVNDLIRQTHGVECRKDADVIDEIPGAYKDIDQVMEAQSDLVRPLHVLKQIICVKG